MAALSFGHQRAVEYDESSRTAHHHGEEDEEETGDGEPGRRIERRLRGIGGVTLRIATDTLGQGEQTRKETAETLADQIRRQVNLAEISCNIIRSIIIT